MKKILMTLMASILLLSSTTYAQGAATHNTHIVQKTSFSKKDAQALFGTNKVKATTLNNGEMKKTEGEFAPVVWFFLATVAANAPSKPHQTFRPENNGYLFAPSRSPWTQIRAWNL